MTSSIMQMSPPVPRLEKTRTGIAGLDDIHVDRSDMSESGHYDLEGLFMTLQSCVESVGAKRVAIDTLENLFGGFDDQALLRLEVRRLFRWLKERNLTTVITAERGDGDLTRQGMEEYVSDCVIILDHLEGRYKLEVIDLAHNPSLARTDKILAIPTLVRNLPPPISRIIGDLSDRERVLIGLNIRKK